MKTRLATSVLAVLGAGGALLIPGTSFAGNIGYYEMCSGQGEAWQASYITSAGHTPVQITVPDAPSLSGLNGFFVTNCDNDGYASEYTSNLAAINNAVTNGLTLFMHDRHVTNAASIMPGAGGIVFTREYATGGSDINLPVGSPVITGPGGTINNTSLDGFSYSSHGYLTVSSLPAGSSVYTVRADPTRAVTVNYPAGAGHVVYSTSPLDAFNGSASFRTYGVNLLANAGLGVSTTCASEGYTSTKLTWCKNICEMGYTGATLDMWIHRWINRYRDLPYCAAGGPPPPPPPPQDT